VSLLGVSDFTFAGAGQQPDFSSNTDSCGEPIYRTGASVIWNCPLATIIGQPLSFASSSVFQPPDHTEVEVDIDVKVNNFCYHYK